LFCVAVALFLVAVLACCVPAQNAMRIEPIIALRHEIIRNKKSNFKFEF